MNSLVVFLSVVALAVAKPSGLYNGGVVAYSSPIIAAAPAAVSHQSRLDIKSSPAVASTVISAAPVAYSAPAAIAAPAVYSAPAIATAAYAPSAVSSQSRIDIKTTPAVTSTFVSAPVAYSAPAAIAAPVAYSAPAAIAAPAVYSAPAIATAAIAPSAVSSQSRIDIKTTPAVTSTVVSAPIAYSAPAVAYSSPAIAYGGALGYSAQVVAAAPAYLKTSYGSPAILKTAAFAAPAAIAAPSVPLETPEVIAARAAHFEAKALAGAHLIRKRSLYAAPLLSSPIATTYAAAPFLSSYHAPLTYSAYSAPIALSTPLITKGYTAW